MERSQISIGMVVRMVSGSLPMVVTDEEVKTDGSVLVLWMAPDGSLKSASLSTAVLEPSPPSYDRNGVIAELADEVRLVLAKLGGQLDGQNLHAPDEPVAGEPGPVPAGEPTHPTERNSTPEADALADRGLASEVDVTPPAPENPPAPMKRDPSWGPGF